MHQSQDPQYKRNPSFHTKKERKEAVDIHLHRPNPRSAKFSLLEPCKRNQEKNRRKKKLQPASQPAKGFLRISRQRNPSSTKRRKKLRNFRKYLHVQTKFTSCRFSGRTMKNATKIFFWKKSTVSEPSTSSVPFSWHTITWNTSHHRFAQSRIQSSALFTKLNLLSTAIASARKNAFRNLYFFLANSWSREWVAAPATQVCNRMLEIPQKIDKNLVPNSCRERRRRRRHTSQLVPQQTER